MKQKNPIALLFAWLAIALVPNPATHAAESSPTAATSQPAGTMSIITGRVSNAATNASLEGAVVRLDRTEFAATTDRDGTYRLQVPAGDYTLAVSYTGLDTQSVPLSVQPGRILQQDVGLTSVIYKMSAFTVSGEREGNALAITLQRQSTGVRSVVSSDAFGNLAGSPADLIKRLPGTTGESVGGDVRYIRIRGMSQNLNTVTLDGNRIADAASAGTTREVQYQQISSDPIERIEVIKSPTPDMDADSIGGAVNFVTKSAFNHSGERRIGGSMGAIWRPQDEREPRPLPDFSISYSEIFGGKLGVAFNYGYRAHNSLIDITSQSRSAVAAGSGAPAFIRSFGTVDLRQERIRWGGGLKLDYKFSEYTRVYFNATSNNHNEHSSETYATYSADNSAIIPGHTNRVTEWSPGETGNSTSLAMESSPLHKIQNAMHYQIGAVHRFQGLDIDWDLFKSTSKTDYPHTKTFSLFANGIGLRIEQNPGEPFFPAIRQTAGPDVTKISSYATNNYDISRRTGWDSYRGAALNVKKTFEAAVPVFIKAGYRVRQQIRLNSSRPWNGTYVGPDGIVGINPATGISDDNIAQFVDPRYKASPGLSMYPKLPFTVMPGHDLPDIFGSFGNNIDTLLRSHPEYFQENIAYGIQSALQGNTRFKERISAGYLMGNIVLGKLTVLGGVRVEQTNVDGEGALNAVTLSEKALRASFQGPLTDDEIRRRTIAQYSERQQRSGKYRQVFPGLHFKYEPLPGLVTRLSYATNIGRPGIGQLIPTTSVDHESRTISTSNPNLKPQFADNFDLTAEYYFEPAGMVSVGIFQKEIRGFIYNAGGSIVGTGADNGFDGQYGGYTLSTQANGGYAKGKGIELNYTQQFAFLPGRWSGFGVYANYTKMSMVGNYGSGTAISPNPTSEIPGFIPSTGNAGISYIRGNISVRIQYNYIGRYLNAYNNNQSLLTYRISRRTADIKTLYQISKHMDVYFDISNIFKEADRAIEYYGGFPQSVHRIVPQMLFGINGRL